MGGSAGRSVRYSKVLVGLKVCWVNGGHCIVRLSECWMFYAVPTARVIFTVKTGLDIFSPRREQVWTFSDLADRIYEMRCLFVAVGLNARCIVLPHWDNMSLAHMLPHPVTIY